MINRNYGVQPHFTSIKIPYDKNIYVADVAKRINKYFTLKGFGDLSPQELRNEIDLSQAAMGINKDCVTIVGKDREADSFLARILKPISPKIEYVEDTPETVFKGPVFDIDI